MFYSNRFYIMAKNKQGSDVLSKQDALLRCIFYCVKTTKAFPVLIGVSGEDLALSLPPSLPPWPVEASPSRLQQHPFHLTLRCPAHVFMELDSLTLSIRVFFFCEEQSP